MAAPSNPARTPALTPPLLAQSLEQQRSTVRVADYYRGDDAAPAFEAAIQIAAANGLSVDIGGEWVFQSACDARGYAVNLVGHAKIDARMVASPFALTFGGSEGPSAPLVANAAQGDSTLICALPVQAGDIIRLVSHETWCRERPYYVKGELARVAASDDGTITLHSQLNDSYHASNTTVTRLNAKPVAIRDGIELNRNTNSGGIMVQWARDIAVKLCFVIQARERSLYFKQCLGGHVADCGCYADHVPGGGTNYGLAFASCAEIHTLGGSYRAGRHAITSGGTFPCRDLQFSDILCDNDDRSGAYCLDAHANGERFTYWNVSALNGAVIQAIDCHFINGHYASRGFLNALSVNPAHDTRYYTFRDVEILNTREGGRGLTLSPAVSGLTLEHCSFTGGRITADIPFYCIPADMGTTRFGSIEFSGGFSFLTTRTGPNTGSLIGPNVADPLIGRVSFSNGYIASYGSGVPLVIRSVHRTIGVADISDCIVDHHGDNDSVRIGYANQARFNSNICHGHGVSHQVAISGCSEVEVNDNRLDGFTQDQGLSLRDNALEFNSNNVLVES